MRYLDSLVLFLLPGLGAVARGELQLQWTHTLPPRKSAWEFTPRVPRDTGHVPVACGSLVLIGCEHNGRLLALDAASGAQRWAFSTNGPIRHAPVVAGERIFVGSDDGHLYCLDAGGKLLWQFRGGPRERLVLGHSRLMSAWPISARPAAADGKVFVVAGYWPVDGIYVSALDAATGKVQWTNNVAQFRPTGAMRVVEKTLFLDGFPGGGAFDVATGAPRAEKPPKPAPTVATDAPAVKGMVTGRFQVGERVIVCTAEGHVHCFADRPAKPQLHAPVPAPEVKSELAEKLLTETGIREGYALVAGLADGSLVAGLVRHSKLHVVALDADPERVEKVRQRLDDLGLFAQHRLDVLCADLARTALPPYFASLIVSESDTARFDGLKECLRPHGGALVRREGERLDVTRRNGPLPGSDDWTHEFHDEGNTLASSDRRVKAPLGTLWYGGEAADARFYYDGKVDHQSGDGLNPQPVPAEIVEGRMILQGPSLLAAFDIYTGRLLWESPLPKVYTFGGKDGGLGIHSKKHPEPWKYPEALKFEVTPTQRCRASGFNFVSLPDGIHVAAGKNLLRFDLATGKQTASWPVPLREEGLRWGGVRAVGNYLIATAFRPQDLADAQAGHDGNGGDWAGDRMPMAHLLVLDRKSGKLLWSRQAVWGFVNRSGIAVGGGKVYCVDLITEGTLKKWKEAGRKLPGEAPRVLALDLASGKEVWSFPAEVRVKNLVYSRERDILLVPCRNLLEWRDGEWLDRWKDIRKGKAPRTAAGRMWAVRGADGKKLWQADTEAYYDPHILLHDLIIDRDGFTYDLRTGKRHERRSALTGEPEPWSFRKSGCNHLIACESLVTWRTAFYDLAGQGGVMKLAGMDAGCSPTLIPAGGILNIPNFGTHHKRNRMTAMALIHRPDNELWTTYSTTQEKPLVEQPVALRRAGFSFGAPGDRVAADGTVWLQVTARNPAGVTIAPREVDWFQKPILEEKGARTVSGVLGATTITIPTVFAAGKKGSGGTVVSRYTVKLHFLEPEALRVGERVFSVGLGGRTVLEKFDIVKVAGRRDVPVVRVFQGVEVRGALTISLTPIAGKTLLCGVELIAE